MTFCLKNAQHVYLTLEHVCFALLGKEHASASSLKVRYSESCALPGTFLYLPAGHPHLLPYRLPGPGDGTGMLPAAGGEWTHCKPRASLCFCSLGTLCSSLVLSHRAWQGCIRRTGESARWRADSDSAWSVGGQLPRVHTLQAHLTQLPSLALRQPLFTVIYFGH